MEQCEKNRAETEDHGQSWRRIEMLLHCNCGRRCSCAGLFYTRRTLDRTGSFLSPDHERRVGRQYFGQFYQAVLCGNTVYPGRIDGAGRTGRYRFDRRVAFSKTKRKGQRPCSEEGTKEKLVELAANNAAMVLSKDKERLKREEGRTIGAVKEIAHMLGISEITRMEAYDISNTNGFESVGSMVVYERGKPKRNDYRKFKIKGIQGADDYGSMREVLTRRFTHGLREREESKELGGFTAFPDLILMDGGKGQVNVAQQVLDELHLHIPVCGMVKDDHHRTRGLYYENEEITIDRSSEAFKLITRIQDEAHRFAIEYHKQLRGKGQVHSILDDIEGIGPARRKALMRSFQNLDEIKEASVEVLTAIPSMNEKAAKSVYNFFHP